MAFVTAALALSACVTFEAPAPSVPAPRVVAHDVDETSLEPGAPDPAALDPGARARSLALSAFAAPRDAPLARRARLDLRPLRSEGQLDRLAVSLRLEGAPRGLPLVLVLREVDQGEPGWPSRIRELSAFDARGPLLLTRSQEPLSVRGLPHAVWTSDREPQGEVDVRYQVALPRAGDGVVYGLRGSAGGLAGPGRTFLALPLRSGAHRIEVRWDLRALPAGSRAACSRAVGDVAWTGALDDLWDESFVAGDVVEDDVDGRDVRALWLGAPAFDRALVPSFVRAMRRAAAAAFDEPAPSPHMVLFRVQVEDGGEAGESSRHGFATVMLSPTTRWTARTRAVIAHELVHPWLGQGLRMRGPGERGRGDWFEEGFTVHYARKLGLRAGVLSAADVALDLTTWARVQGAFSPDEPRGALLLPYARGSLYAAELDAAIRAASRGARSLDHVVRALLSAARARGDAWATAAQFRELVRAELGDDGARRFDEVIAGGAAPAPPPGAYGPCIRRDASGAWERVAGIADDVCTHGG